MPTFVVDFETESIEPRPKYPPVPVGCAVKEYGARKAEYLAWGHPTQNNVTKADARRHLLSLWKRATLIFHGAKFDLDVGRTHLDLPFPSPERVHCTLIEAFILDPNRQVLSLKPMSEELLGMPPDEQTALYTWIALHVPEARRALADAERRGIKAPELGAWIAKAPGRLVGRYARGDLIRTEKIHNLCQRHLDREERDWYTIERRLMLHLLDEEKEGVPIDVPFLEREVARGTKLLAATDEWLRKRLKLPKGVELSQNQKVADAMEACGMVEEWILTDKGNRSTAYDNLKQVCLDEPFLDVWGFRSLLSTQLQTFARPWLEIAREHGRVFPSWNQVRQVNERSKGKAVGARTGRLSSTPNFQNVPKIPRPIARTYAEWKKWKDTETPAYLVPLKMDPKEIQLLNMRAFIVAPRGQRIFDRDYSQQELRILAHYEQGTLLAAYQANPTMDVHHWARGLVNAALNANYPRGPIKNTGFGIIYGLGIGGLAEKIEAPYDVAKQLRRTYLAAIPGLKALIDALKSAARNDEYLRTWGGRRFKCEEPIIVQGHLRTLEYKLINTLIQGSAADCTKMAMVSYFDHPQREGRLILSVHDQLAGLAKTKAAVRQMKILTQCMETVPFRLPMLTTGKIVTRWSDAK